MRNMARAFIPAVVIAVFALAGCAPPFPKDLLRQVDSSISFTDLKKDPDRYRGKMLMLGGMIIETRNLPTGTRIEILQKPLTGGGRPAATDETGGRFLAETTAFLDSAVYLPGRALTVIGEADGSREQQLGAVPYRYPVVTVKDLHLWAPYSGPHFSIGIGVYRGF